MEKEKISFKSIFENMDKVGLGFAVFILYITTPLYEAFLFKLLGINAENVPTFMITTFDIVIRVLLLGLILFAFKNVIIKDIKDLKKNHKQYFKEYLKFWFLAVFLMMASNALITIVTNQEVASNEQAVRDMLIRYPLYTYLMAVIFAPITEELVFRLGFRNIFKHDFIFILVSGLVFGGLHIIQSENLTSELVYLIPYSIPGMIFAYVYTKSKNIFIPIGLHFIHNGILMSLNILLLLFN